MGEEMNLSKLHIANWLMLYAEGRGSIRHEEAAKYIGRLEAENKKLKECVKLENKINTLEAENKELKECVEWVNTKIMAAVELIKKQNNASRSLSHEFK